MLPLALPHGYLSSVDQGSSHPWKRDPVPGRLGYFIPFMYLGTYSEFRSEGMRPAAEPKEKYS